MKVKSGCSVFMHTSKKNIREETLIDSQVIAEAKKQLVAQNKEKVLEIANKVIADGGDPLAMD